MKKILLSLVLTIACILPAEAQLTPDICKHKEKQSKAEVLCRYLESVLFSQYVGEPIVFPTDRPVSSLTKAEIQEIQEVKNLLNEDGWGLAAGKDEDGCLRLVIYANETSI
jgi:hypothetical protein